MVLSYAMRRVMTLVFVLLAVGGWLFWEFGEPADTNPQDIPLVKAEGSYKQRPEEPGGINIPHQDVQVYQELDAKNNDKDQVEHLLPPPETPQLSQAPSKMPPVQPTAPHVESLMTDLSSSNTPPVPTTVYAPQASPSAPTPASAPVASVTTSSGSTSATHAAPPCA